MFLSQSQFNSLAEISSVDGGYTHIPIMREILADLDTPVSTYLKLANQPYTYLFESVTGGDKWGRYSIIGLPCNTVYQVRGYELTKQVDGKLVEKKQLIDPLQTIREIQSQYKVAEIDGLPPMYGGLVGYFGYETIAYIESCLPHSDNLDPIDAPDILLMVSEDVLVFDNVAGGMFLITLAATSKENAYESAQARLTEYVKTLSASFTPPQKNDSETDITEGDYDVHFPQVDFEQAVERCKEYIREGDIMQVVLSQRLSTPYTGIPFDVYRSLRVINPSPYMYFMNVGDFDIVGSSPEILVRVSDDTVTVRPIAGTRKRGKNENEDLRLEQELLSDEKECAEHLMLIDLGRNDVGRIAETGSVQLTENMLVERYSHVMHIVSNVDGKLKPELDALDVLAATFPAGTVSGAPKIRAMEIIAELEPLKRGVYSGAIGYLGWNGNMDTAIAIRTAVIKDEVLYIQAGAGIVSDSVPKYEWKETLSKARAMFKAVEMANSGLGLNSVNASSKDKSSGGAI